MSQHSISIGVIGGATSTPAIEQQAYDVGRHIALNQAVLICGGKGGVMQAASRGAAENGGVVVGLLPGTSREEANPWVSIAIPTGLGIARNTLVVQASDVLIAFPGSFGTLSEISIALAIDKPVVYMPGAWNLKRIGIVDSARFKEAVDPAHAIGLALGSL